MQEFLITLLILFIFNGLLPLKQNVKFLAMLATFLCVNSFLAYRFHEKRELNHFEVLGFSDA
jgi:Ca2+/Na+ antiporter